MSTAEDLANTAGMVSNARSSNIAKKYAQKIQQFKNYCALKTEEFPTALVAHLYSVT